MIDYFKSYFKPNWMKVLLTVLLFAPSLVLLFTLNEVLSFLSLFINFDSPYVLVWGLILGYLFACTLDTLIKSKVIKIIIATISAAISLWIISKLLWGAGTVSEYALEPGECEVACRNCQAACRTIYDNAVNKTSELVQKMEECMQGCRK